MAERFDPTKPCVTESGYPVIITPLKTKIVGFVLYDEDTALTAVWDLTGKKYNIFPRKKNDVHNLDLVNVEE
jgi:hypothetical protein